MSQAIVSAVVRFAAVCWSVNQETQGRCRNLRCGVGGLCPTHQKMADEGNGPPESPLPHVILFKRKISKSRADKLMALGIREEEGQDPVAKFEAASASADDQGRSGKAYDFNETGRKDDGSLIFDVPRKHDKERDANGKLKKGQGPKKITVLKALMDLGKEYEVTGIHLEPTKDQNPHMRNLIVACTIKHKEVPSVLTDALLEIVASIFTGTYDAWIWANAPKPSGVVVHTVNLGWKYEQKKPTDPPVVTAAELRFDENERGAWKLNELLPAA